MKKEKNPYLKLFLKIFVSSLLLIWIFKTNDLSMLRTHLSSLNPSYIPVIFGCIILNYVISSVRWKKLLGVFEGAEHVSLFTLTKLYFVGAFFNTFLPTGIGGDVYKAYKLGSLLKDQSKAFASTFMERFTGLAVLALFSLLGLTSLNPTLGLLFFILFILGGVSGYAMLGLIGKKVPKLKKFTDALKVYKNRRDILVYALVTSVFVQIFSVLTQYFIFVALGQPISLGLSFFAFPLIFLASVFIPSLGSFGVQEFLYSSFFSNMKAVAITASLVYQAVKIVTSLIGGLFYATDK